MDFRSDSVRRIIVVLLAILCVSEVLHGQIVPLKDRSDWWSINNESFRPPNAKGRSGNLAVGTFQIARVALGSDQFDKLAEQMGKAPIAKRGDASTGRQQVCYVATEGQRRVYLIFEFGAAEQSTFYLFSDGEDWTGQKLCVRTNKVSLNLVTPSGLKLGLTRPGVEAVLGKPDAVLSDRYVYFREVQERTTNTEFQQLRNDYPDRLTDQAAHDKFDFLPVQVHVETRFGKSGVSYLAVSKWGEIQ
jgi:hypothetical protein